MKWKEEVKVSLHRREAEHLSCFVITTRITTSGCCAPPALLDDLLFLHFAAPLEQNPGPRPSGPSPWIRFGGQLRGVACLLQFLLEVQGTLSWTILIQ